MGQDAHERKSGKEGDKEVRERGWKGRERARTRARYLLFTKIDAT